METAAMKVWNRNFFILWQGQLVSFLGDVVYSIALGFWVLQTTGSTALMGGMSIGFLTGSVVKVPPAARFGWFTVCAYVQGAGMAIFPQLGSLVAMAPILLVGGVANAILNSYLMAVIQMSVPRMMLGKVSSLLMTRSEA
jgi:DHA3 family macrolide efflux protein-like MFS transporter